MQNLIAASSFGTAAIKSKRVKFSNEVMTNVNFWDLRKKEYRIARNGISKPNLT